MSATPPEKRNWSDLRPRLISAFVMAVVCFSLIYSGLYGTALITFVGSCVMIWEWSRMATKGETRGSLVEIVSGFAVIIAASLGFLWLRSDANFGLLLAIWLPFVVIAADAGAYFAGRIFGGPKLAPSISPNKTVSGALGGLVLAVVIGVAVSAVAGVGTAWIVGVVSLFTAIASQLGDLLESAAKRRYGVKDASNILPGHGGVLDRFDGLLVAILLTVLLTMVAGSPVFAW